MILVSACLAGVSCRMDGRSKTIPEIRALVDAGLAVAVCPEVLGGLETPRAPSEIRDGRVVNTLGLDVTDAFVRGAEKAFAICREKGCTKAVLKSRSPSCGVGRVHNGRFDGGLTDGNGVFAAMLLKEGIPVMTEEDDLEGLQCGKPGAEGVGVRG